MNVTLSGDLEKRVEELVSRGAYPSADALVQDAVGSFLDVEGEEDLESVRRRLAAAEAEIDRGEFVEYDAENIGELVGEVQARGQKKLAKQGNCQWVYSA
jgi:Arc/MetJ-type ribon-helix-helix transcriptional regulator